MDFSDIFRIVNLAVGVFMVLGGISQLFPLSALGVKNIITTIYAIIFGLGTAFLEFQIPPILAKYASFMFSFIGRGVFYVFVGTVLMGPSTWHNIIGAVVALIGIAYCVLEFIPSIEPPANMRDADPSWGAEQI